MSKKRAKELKLEMREWKQDVSGDISLARANFGAILEQLGAWDKIANCANCDKFMYIWGVDDNYCSGCEEYFCDTCLIPHKQISEILGGCD